MASALACANASNKKRKKRAMTEKETCEYCGDTVDDCIDAEECNYGQEGSLGPDEDALYEAYKEQKADEYFDSQE